MATLLLWQFDKFLKKNKLAAYNKPLYNQIVTIKIKKEQEEEKKALEEIS